MYACDQHYLSRLRDLVWIARVEGIDGEVSPTHSLVDPMMNQPKTHRVALL